MLVSKARHVVDYDVALLIEDMARKGWVAKDLAAKAGVAGRSVGRFLNGDVQTVRMLAKLATALGYEAGRYVVRRAPKDESLSITRASAAATP